MTIRLSQIAALLSVALMIGAACVLNQPDDAALANGLQRHVLGFLGFAKGDPLNGTLLHLQSMKLIHTPDLTRGVLVIGWGGLALVVALAIRPRPVFWWVPAGSTRLPGRIHRKPLAAGIAALAALAETNGRLLGILPPLPTHLQFGLFALGIGLAVWGLGGGAWGIAWDRREVLPVLAITALALGLRAWDLENSVHRLVDEAHYLNAINTLNAQSDTRLLDRFSPITSFPYLYPYLQALSVDVVGRSLSAIRLVSVLFGTLTIPAVYFLGRTLFERRIGLLAALFLAVYPPHIHFSRLGINNIADPLFGVLALAFLARGLRDNRRLDFALGGAALGLTQYFYEGGRLLFPPLIALWLFMVWGAWRTRIPARGIGIALLALVITAAPLYYTFVGVHSTVDPRMQEVGLGSNHLILTLFTNNSAVMQAQLWHSLLAFLAYIYLPDISWFYSDTHPLLLVYAAPLALLGIVVALWRARNPGALLLLLWVILATVPQGLLIDSTWAPRFVAVFPALALLVALGLYETLRLLWPDSDGKTRRPAIRLAAAMLVIAVIGAAQVRAYFGPTLDHFNATLRSDYDGEDALFRSLEFPHGTQVHIVSNLILWPLNIDAILGFWQADLAVDLVRPDTFTPEYLAGLPRDVDQAFFIEPDDQDAIDLLHSQFSTGAPTYSPYNVPHPRQLVLFYAPVAAYPSE